MFSGFSDFRFPDTLLKRKNLIGSDDPVPDPSKSCFNVLCYMVKIYIGNHALTYYAIWSYYTGYVVLWYMIILYGNRALTYYAIVLPDAPWCFLAKWCEQGADRYKTTRNHSRPKPTMLHGHTMDGLTIWNSLRDALWYLPYLHTYHTGFSTRYYSLVLRGALPRVPWYFSVA